MGFEVRVVGGRGGICVGGLVPYGPSRGVRNWISLRLKGCEACY